MIGVLVVEDMEVVRAGLVALLDGELGIEVRAQAGDEAQALDAIESAAPDVALLDMDAPGMDGLTLAREPASRAPACRTIALTFLDRPGRMRQALDAGVSGYVLKSVSGRQLARAALEVASGARAVEPRRLADVPWPYTPLTVREAQALRLAAGGATAQEIAAGLFLGVGTARNRLSAVVGKLDARGLVDAIRIAERQGWI
ncbi:response regulator transcription factor [Streptomyces roseirectus]|uniref:Response regulator transcription factor n=1 Tax=Streptomyces roseirectus TaxID=2768066 RepID=A0A7H0INY1_9ACTN|nr:response regulator transcription factor [Streptomyces roseirectus]QNP74497.1 response regulator transcription factor [Streptomyces roseirectus]